MEGIAARWSELDLGQQHVDDLGGAHQDRRGAPHPLAPAAVRLLRRLGETKVNEFVFPGPIRVGRCPIAPCWPS